MHGKFAKLTCEIERLLWATCRISSQLFMVNFWTSAALYIDSLWAHLYVDAMSQELWGKLNKNHKKAVWAHHHAEERGRVTMTNDEAIEYLRKEISEEEMGQHLAIMDQDMAKMNITVVWAFSFKKYEVPGKWISMWSLVSGFSWVIDPWIIHHEILACSWWSCGQFKGW